MIYEEIKNWDEDIEAYGVSPLSYVALNCAR